jgi:predicted solute-binding protein
MDIAVTGHTRTTEFYMGKVLEGLGISYRAVRRPETAGIELLRSSDYALVIGDEALEAYVDGSTVLLDIGREFSSMFMLPPVYAVTVTTGKEDTVPGLDMGRLQESAAKHSGMAAKEASARLSLPEKLFENYYSRIGYSWDSSVMGTIEFVSDELDRPCDPNDAWRRPA